MNSQGNQVDPRMYVNTNLPRHASNENSHHSNGYFSPKNTNVNQRNAGMRHANTAGKYMSVNPPPGYKDDRTPRMSFVNGAQ